MPLKKYFLRFLLSISFFSVLSPAYCQSVVIDSLDRAVREAPAKDKPIVMAELAKANFERDLSKAIGICRKAIVLAKDQHYKAAEGFCYATMAHLMVQQNREYQASLYIDSAQKAIAGLNNPTVCSFVWFRKGWLEMVMGNNEKAMASLLKADLFIKNIDNYRAMSYRVLINHYLSSIYAYGNDISKERKYALACMQSARASIWADDLQTAYMTVAHSFYSTFFKNPSRQTLLDSSLNYYRRALGYYKTNKERILLQSNASATALNIANIYFKHYPAAKKDSAEKYISLAISIAKTSNGKEVLANGYGILSEYALRDRDYKKAEAYLNQGIAELSSMSDGADMTRSRLMLGLANVAESSGDIKKALSYYKRYNAFHEKVFDVQKLAITQKLEEQYQSSRRENEIIRLQEKDKYNKRQNWMYVVIGSGGIISLILLLSSYHYKLRASQQEKKLSDQQKEEAELLAKLQQGDALRLQLEKKEVELRASLKEEESARLQAQQELLQDRTQWLEKALLAGTLKIEEKNALLEVLKEKASLADSPVVARQIKRIVNQNLRMDKNGDELQSIIHTHPGLFNALQAKADNSLTKLDLKYCAYIAMGMENNDIAMRLGVEAKSIRMTRYRLKQKLKLDKDQNLDQFINNL